jgi:Xaa-Pro aminopeptidase
MYKLTAPLLLIGATEDYADVRHASGFTAPDPFLFLEDGTQKILLVSMLEYGRALATAQDCRVLLAQDLPVSKAEQRRMSGCAWGLLKLLGRRSVCVSQKFPIAIARRLEHKGIRVSVLTTAPYPQRAVKTEPELAAIARVQRAAAASIGAAAQCLRTCTVDRAGLVRCRGKILTSEELRIVIELELVRHNCNPGDSIVSSGPMSANPHECGRGPIRAGTPIILDIFPSCKTTGYFGDITRTLVKGRAPAALQKMLDAVYRGQRRALQTIRAGVAVRTPCLTVTDYFKRRGFVTEVKDGVARGFIHGLGHGVGLEIHEAPSLSARAVGRLRAGHVVTVEPGLYDPEIGGVRFEDTIVVTRTGWRALAACDVPWEL